MYTLVTDTNPRFRCHVPEDQGEEKDRWKFPSDEGETKVDGRGAGR